MRTIYMYILCAMICMISACENPVEIENVQTQHLHTEITITISPEESGTVEILPLKKYYRIGEMVTIRANSSMDYHFSAWIDLSSEQNTAEESGEIVLQITRDLSIHAEFRKNPRISTTVMPENAGRIVTDPDMEFYPPGTEVSLRAEAMEDYYFQHWICSGNSDEALSTDPVITFILDESRQLTAVYQKNASLHTLVVPPGAGTISVNPEGFSLTPGTEVSFFAAASPGFIFSHWDINGTHFFEPDPVVLIDTTVQARAVFIPRRKTILIYMAADNELESYALQDLNKLEIHNIEARGISVLVLLDRPSGAALYQLQRDPQGYHPAIASRQLDSQELGLSSQELHPINMGNPATLKAFVREGLIRLPAERYSIIIWGHGSGWRSERDAFVAIPNSQSTGLFRASAYDDGSGDALYTAELAAGLSEIKRFDPALRWTTIGLEVCKGLMMEVLYELRGLSYSVAGSPDVIPAAGWDYGLIGSGLMTLDPEKKDSLGNLLAESFAAAYSGTAKASFSVINLDEIDELNSAWNSFSMALAEHASNEEKRQILLHVLFHQVQDYFLTPGDLNIDMGHAATVIAAEIPELHSATETFLDIYRSSIFRVFTSGIGNENASGIAIHLVPLNENGTAVLPHAPAYFRDEQVSHSLGFVQNSVWPPDSQGGGLLGRLWYGE